VQHGLHAGLERRDADQIASSQLLSGSTVLDVDTGAGDVSQVDIGNNKGGRLVRARRRLVDALDVRFDIQAAE
jgi:hypothetical protein